MSLGLNQRERLRLSARWRRPEGNVTGPVVMMTIRWSNAGYDGDLKTDIGNFN